MTVFLRNYRISIPEGAIYFRQHFHHRQYFHIEKTLPHSLRQEREIYEYAFYPSHFVSCLLCSLCATLTGCQKTADSDKKYASIDDFGSAVIGDNTASVLGAMFKEQYPDAVINYYDDNSAICAALQKGDVEAAIPNEPVARNIAATYTDFAIFPTMVATDSYGMLFSDGNALRDSFSEYIEAYRKDGTMDALREKWFGADTAAKVIDREAYAVTDPAAKTIRVTL